MLGEFRELWYPIRMTRQTTRVGAGYRFDELVIWRTRLPQVKHAVLPPSNNRPNPLVTDNVVYVSVFSPGAICALDRKTGKLLWRREILKFAGSAVHLARGRLFAKTANTLYVLEPKTGKTIWSFCPYGDSGESIYSAPTIHRDSVFVGDRSGYLHCLDFRTGETRWKQRTSKTKNCDVNSTPVVVKRLVIVGTNAKMAAGYDTKTGKRVWVRRLDGPSVFGSLLYQNLLAVVTDSIYLLKPESGKVVRKFSWTPDGVTVAECTRGDIIAILRGSPPTDGTVRLVGLSERGIQFTEHCRSFVAFLHYAPERKLIYVSHLKGIDIRRAENGLLACQIQRENREAVNGPVDVRRNTIYVLTGDGYVYALRHPSV
jgi:outer membrane protein assembly factor BamB